ncbi:importin beta binding domain-containing protein [Aspergillus germanicus]
MAERYIPEHRRTQYKARNQFRPDELRRRREEQQVEIRKQKREENLAKRRGIQTRDGGIGVGGGMAAAESDDEASAIESEVRGVLLCYSLLNAGCAGYRVCGHPSWLLCPPPSFQHGLTARWCFNHSNRGART